MAAENLQLLEEIFEQFNRIGQPPRESMHDDVTWMPIREDPDFEVRHGIDAVQRYLAEWGEAFDELHAERVETVPAGEKVFVWVRLTGRGRSAGIPIEMEQGLVYTFREGRIARGEEYTDRTEAMRAAGIEAVADG